MSRNNSTKQTRTTKAKAEAAPIHIQREVKPTRPSADEVRRRAYEIYLQRMQSGEPGSPESDWSRAERELTRV